jgi:predicted nucleotidyltransferase
MYLDKFKEQLPPLCQKYHVKSLWAFGSVLTDRFRPDSDVDIIAVFDRPAIDDLWITFFDFKDSLEVLFNRPVDLLTDQPIRNSILRKSIDNTKQLIYGRAS